MTNPLVALGHARPEPVVRLHHPRPRHLGRARPADRRGRPARHDDQPDDLREGDRRAARSTTTTSAASRRRAATPAEIFEALAVRRRAGGVRRLPPGVTSGRAGSTAWCRSKSPDAGARHRRHGRRGGAALASGRSAQCDDQDSRHAGGTAGDHPAAWRRVSTSTSPCSLRSNAIADGGRGLPDGARAARGRAAADQRHRVGGELLREPGRRQGRPLLDAKGDPQALAGTAAIANACAAYAVFEEPFWLAALAGAGGRGRHRAAAAVGLDQHQGSQAPGYLLRRGADRATADGEHPATRHLRGLPRPRSPGGADPRGRGRAPGRLRALAEAGIDLAAVTRSSRPRAWRSSPRRIGRCLPGSTPRPARSRGAERCGPA